MTAEQAKKENHQWGELKGGGHEPRRTVDYAPANDHPRNAGVAEHKLKHYLQHQVKEGSGKDVEEGRHVLDAHDVVVHKVLSGGKVIIAKEQPHKMDTFEENVDVQQAHHGDRRIVARLNTVQNFVIAQKELIGVKYIELYENLHQALHK